MLVSNNKLDIEEWASLRHLRYSKYSASTYGRVRNDKRQQILKGSINNGGYPAVTLKMMMVMQNFVRFID